MFDKLISFSIKNKIIIGFATLALVIWGGYSFKQIPIDAVPDITTNQVQIITQTPTLATQEVEQFVTFPIEISMSNIPDVTEIRSISRFGLSVVTVVFEEDVDIYLGRQLISEQLKIAERDIPSHFGSPELGPITTGLGEVYQYVVRTEPGYESEYSDMDLRTIHDWIVKRQLAGTPGVIEVSGWGGHKKQYEVAVDPNKLNSYGISIKDVFEALQQNNENAGGSYIEKKYNTYYLRGEGLIKDLEDLGKVVVTNKNGIPLLIRDVAAIGFGSAPRYGAITWNGKGEVVGGQTLMLKGKNSFEVVQAVKERIEEIKKSLPEGVTIEPFLDRSELISRAIGTVRTNLIEGGLIVVLVLVLLLGNFRGGLIVASVIPLALLFAIGMMNLFGVSANLMSLGAIDFGLVVDGSVIIVEAIIHRLYSRFNGTRLSREKMDKEVGIAASKIRSSAAFGEIIILIVYLPILALVGIEGKMFSPMAQTVSFAILGALILSLTYVPMMSSWFLKKNIQKKNTISDKIISAAQKVYQPFLQKSVKRSGLVLVISGVLFGMSIFTFNRMGGEFIPTLEEGDFALHQILPPGSSLQQSVEVSEKIQQTLLDHFPEVITVVSKIGTSEIPTDPMPIEVGDIMVKMKPKSEWTSGSSTEEMFEKMEAVLSEIPGVQYEFTQPIQMRFNELIAGVREDIAIKIFGENPDVLSQKAKEAEKIISQIDGVGDLRVEQTQGLPQLMVKYHRNKIAQYGLNIKDLNLILRAAFAGEVAGQIFEEERRFDLVVRFDTNHRKDITNIEDLYVPLPNGKQIPLREVASIDFEDGPIQISREDAKRKIVIGVNCRNRDTESLVEAIQSELEQKLVLPSGYSIKYGGQYQNLIEAKNRLMVAVPAALLLILILLFITFRSIKQALLIFTAIPLSAIGGVYALYFRGLPFSISAGIGFIALFGVAVLNGIVLIAYFNQLKSEGVEDLNERIFLGTQVRLRPVLMTAAVAALGFLPMALSTSAGAEVQRPLATVVIGGLITATLLTLVVLPILYKKLESFKMKIKPNKSSVLVLAILLGLNHSSFGQNNLYNLERCIEHAKEKQLSNQISLLEIEKAKALKKTSFNPAPTQLLFSNGQINADVQDYQFQVVQSFDFPSVYFQKNKLGEELIKLSQAKRNFVQAEIEKNVKANWWEISYYIEKQKRLKELSELADKFQQASIKRFENGEINLLEKTIADNQHKKLQLELINVNYDLVNSINHLQFSVLGLEKIGYRKFLYDSLRLIQPLNTKAYQLEGAHLVTISEQELVVATKQVDVQKAKNLPNLNLGYMNQQIEGVHNLSSIQFGIGLPIFFKAQKNQKLAAIKQGEIARKSLENSQLQYRIELTQLLSDLNKEINKIKYFQESEKSYSMELLKIAEESFEQGEINFMVYAQLIRDSYEQQFSHLNSINNYNQTIIKIQALTQKNESNEN